ncbi:hypothetical protein V1517DRAFT_315892 [Lipomyces orientalis]|uniref:Uncharacterized protein n=1 Tax=Lipomyces orientalis TaxID=1233043 RepID=A0ACC3TVQ2_9ASCO
MPKSKPSFKEVHDAMSSVSRLRKKIRDLERLLKRPTSASNGKTIEKNSTAIARREQERALRALKDELRVAERSAKEKKLDKRYHKVRFFERRKAARRVIQARKTVAGLSDERNEEKRKVAGEELLFAETELAYVALYPREWKYVSLYVHGGLENVRKGLGETETEKKRLEWWAQAERRVRSGEVDVDSLMFWQGDKRQQNSRKTSNPFEDDNEDDEQNKHELAEEDEFFEKE